MNHNELAKLLQAVSSVWEKCDARLLEQHYSKSFQANYYGNEVSYDGLGLCPYTAVN